MIKEEVQVKLTPNGFIVEKEYIEAIKQIPIDAIIDLFEPYTVANIPVVLIGEVENNKFTMKSIEVYGNTMPDELFNGIMVDLKLLEDDK